MRRAIIAIATVALVGLIAGGIAAASWVMSVVNETPDIQALRARPAGAISTVYAADGTRLGFIAGDILRTPVDSSDIPLTMKRATVAIEDRRFYKHRGVDYVGVVRAAVKNVTEDRTSQGGSTLTMQLVRNLYIPDDRFKKSLTRKIREAKLADQLEKEHSKEWILTSYMNNVPFGNTLGGKEAIGVQAAARVFFDKPASRLTLPEAALLAGLPQAPSDYNPFVNPRGARKRRTDVLNAMADARYITQAEADEAAASPLGVKENGFYLERKEPFVFDYVREQLIRKYGPEVVRAGGLKVYTSIDLRKQEAARAAIASRLYDPGDPASAIATVDPSNGHILAMASSARYGDDSDGGTNYNYATAQRQPGSTFKVMVLMAALRKGIDPDSTSYVSRPLGAGWLPGYPTYDVATFGHSYSGSESITRATLSSDNTVYAQLAADVGPESVRQAAYDLGVTSRLDAYPAEALGGLTRGVTTLEMASAYATIANGGTRIDPTVILKVKHRNGQVEDIAKRMKRKRTFSEAEAAEARRVLEMNVTSGTGTNAGFGCAAGGKTGTTSDSKDAWFVGFTPRLSTAVWIGHVQPTEMYSVHGIGVQGGTIPAMIWHDYMLPASAGYCGSDWPNSPAFSGSAFFGRYSSTGSDEDEDNSYDGTSDSGTTDGTTGTDAGTDDTGTGTGAANPDPDAYARPPQEAPDIQPPSGGGTEGGGAGAPNG